MTTYVKPRNFEIAVSSDGWLYTTFIEIEAKSLRRIKEPLTGREGVLIDDAIKQFFDEEFYIWDADFAGNLYNKR